MSSQRPEDGDPVDPIDVQRDLRGVDYPASKNELIEKALENGADDDVLLVLRALPDQTYDGVPDVSRALENLR